MNRLDKARKELQDAKTRLAAISEDLHLIATTPGAGAYDLANELIAEKNALAEQINVAKTLLDLIEAYYDIEDQTKS